MGEARYDSLPPLSAGEVRVARRIHAAGFRMDPHVHPFYEIGYVVAGRGRYETPGNSIAVSGGCLLLWSGRVPHRAEDEACDPLHQVIIMADDSVLSGRSFFPELSALLARGEPLLLPVGSVGPSTVASVRRAAAEARAGALGAADILSALVVEICVGACRRLAEADAAPDCPSTTDPRIAPVLRDLRARCSQDLGPETYAGELGISVRRFSELFRRATGRTFVEHLSAVRIGRARELLVETDEKVVDIAFEIGFGNLSHFNRTFKKLTGRSPLDFRKAQGGLP
jgi:AraC family transcriptional regulator, arabinose operon regulatory protein